MKKNSGMTIVEIIISLSIISIVLIFLFTLLIHVRNEDLNNNVQSNFVVNQSTFIKTIEEDIVSYGIKAISPCVLSDANISSTIASGYEDKYKCIKIDYATDYLIDRTAFIFIYRYYTKYESDQTESDSSDSKWMIQYIRGNYEKCIPGQEPVRSSWKNKTTIMREMPEEIDISEAPYVLYTALPNQKTNAASLVIPIVTTEGEHYDINLSFTFKGNDNFKCDNFDKTKLNCRCQSPNTVCDKTYNYTNICS